MEFIVIFCAALVPGFVFSGTKLHTMDLVRESPMACLFCHCLGFYHVRLGLHHIYYHHYHQYTRIRNRLAAMLVLDFLLCVFLLQVLLLRGVSGLGNTVFDFMVFVVSHNFPCQFFFFFVEEEEEEMRGRLASADKVARRGLQMLNMYPWFLNGGHHSIFR